MSVSFGRLSLDTSQTYPHGLLRWKVSNWASDDTNANFFPCDRACVPSRCACLLFHLQEAETQHLLKPTLGYEQRKNLLHGMNQKCISSSAVTVHAHSSSRWPPEPVPFTALCPLLYLPQDFEVTWELALWVPIPVTLPQGAKQVFHVELKNKLCLEVIYLCLFGCSFIEKAGINIFIFLFNNS